MIEIIKAATLALQFGILGLCFGNIVPLAAAESRPNILFLMADD